MTQSRWRAAKWMIAVLLSGVLAACNSEPRAPRVDASTCPVSVAAEPTCGALWGIVTQVPTNAALDEAEAQAGRTFDLVYRFHDINDVFPTSDEREVVEAGRFLHLAIESRDFSSPDPAAGTLAKVASGAYDAELRRQAKGIASLDAPVFLTFDHEVDQPARTALGSPQEFIEAWRHVHDVYTEAGASNAVWVWVILGWEPSLDVAAAYWPGNDVVDWISWDVYNQSGCRGAAVTSGLYRSFEDDIALVYDWVHETGPSLGMDPKKPMMISELGSVIYPESPQLSAKWYSEIPSVLREYPQVKAVTLWDHTGHLACDYRFGRDPVVLEAVVNTGHDDWVNVHKP